MNHESQTDWKLYRIAPGWYWVSSVPYSARPSPDEVTELIDEDHYAVRFEPSDVDGLYAIDNDHWVRLPEHADLQRKGED